METPFIGMPATIHNGTDSHAGVVYYIEGKIVGVQHEKARIVSGSIVDGSAVYEYTANPLGNREYFRQNKAGKWVKVYHNAEGDKRWINAGFGCAGFGYKREYYDPHF